MSQFAEFCHDSENISPLEATTATVVRYVAWTGEREHIGAKSLQPYMSAINTFFELHNHDPIAKDSLHHTAAMRGLMLRQRRLETAPLRVPLHDDVAYNFVEKAELIVSVPTTEYQHDFRALVVSVVNFMFFARGLTSVSCRVRDVHVDDYNITLLVYREKGRADRRGPDDLRVLLLSVSEHPRVARLLHHFIDNVQALPRKTTRLLTFPKNKTNIQNKQTNKRFVFTLLLYGANWAAVRLSIRMVTDTMKAPGATLQAVAVASGEGRGGAAAQLSVAGHARSRSSAGEGPPCRSLVDALEDELPQNGARPSLAKRHSIGDAIGKCPSAPLEPVRSPLRAHAASQLSQSFANVTAVASSMAGRGPQREEDVRRTFSLDGEEILRDDWSCALMSNRKILLQGRLYLFNSFVCFYSNVFGISKKVKVPLTEVISIRKRKNAGVIPNSIEVVHCGKAHFFTSFLSRDDAYRVLMRRWRECSNFSRLYCPTDSSVHDGQSSNQSSPKLQAVSCVSGPPSDDLDLDEGSSDSMDAEGTRTKRHAGVISKSQSANARVAFLLPPQLLVEEQERSPSGYSSDGEMEDTEGDAAAQGVLWEPKQDAAPACAPEYKVMMTEVLQCTPLQFFSTFIADHSTFWRDLLIERGDRDVKFDLWAKHSTLGTVRTVYFISPVKAPIGPPETRCHQSQRYNVYGGDHFVLETSQVMNDIPYGDHFTVDMRWDVTPQGSAACQVELRINIPFSRKTMFKGKIESTTASETKSCFSTWMAKAKQHLQNEGAQNGKLVPTVRRKGCRKKSMLGPQPTESSTCEGTNSPSPCSPEADSGLPSAPLQRRLGGLLAGARGLVMGLVTQKPKALAMISLVLMNLYLLSSGSGSACRQEAPEALLLQNMLDMQRQIVETQQLLAGVSAELSETTRQLKEMRPASHAWS
eukprot:jgi/Tetstr1/462988/TSEL_007929.t2